MFPLPIFPEGGLASSVITTVWVGVFVLCFFNLRYGWVLSGLVVPGYLVPLLIVKPMAALVIVVEAILTYAIVWFFSEKMSPGRFPSLFGRDRFMGLILASIAVRLALDGWILPQAAEWLSSNYNQQLDWQSDLRSFGLVIVSLLANQFWKPGLARGLFAMIVTTAISYAIVRYGLMELTNFRMSGVSYLYEGLASSMLASPKAYMILVLTALYASHMNVRYGWDFSGILIPALIALQWYQPTKILTSFVEAALIYAVARQVLKLPFLANVTMEGANKILLFFNISFVLKLIVGHLLVWLAWDVKTTDFYGFGYLLSTLLAMKAHDKDIFPRLMRSTLQVSFVGAAAGNLAGIALAALLPAGAANANVAARPFGGGGADDDLLVRAIGDSVLRRETRADAALSADQREALIQSIALLEAGLPPFQAGAGAAAGGWRLVPLENGLIAIARADGVGSDLIVFDRAAPRDVALVVSDASEPGLAFAALDLRARLSARWLVLTTPQPPGARPGEAVLTTFRSARPGVELLIEPERPRQPASLRLTGRSATALDLSTLRNALPGLAIGFAPEREAMDDSAPIQARLGLPPAALDALLAEPRPTNQPMPACESVGPAANERTVRSLPQRLFLREQIVRPLLALTDTGDDGAFAPIRRAAQVAGFDLVRCKSGGRTLIALAGSPRVGRYVFDPAGDADRLVMSASQVDTPGVARDAGGSATLAPAGFELAAAGRAKVLALAPRELVYDDSQASAFGVVVQTAIDEMGHAPGLIVQLRSRPRLENDAFPNLAVVTMDRLGEDSAAATDVAAILRGAGYIPKLAGRDRQTAGFEAFSQTALLYLNHSLSKRYAVVFVPLEEEP